MIVVMLFLNLKHPFQISCVVFVISVHWVETCKIRAFFFRFDKVAG